MSSGRSARPAPICAASWPSSGTQMPSWPLRCRALASRSTRRIRTMSRYRPRSSSAVMSMSKSGCWTRSPSGVSSCTRLTSPWSVARKPAITCSAVGFAAVAAGADAGSGCVHCSGDDIAPSPRLRGRPVARGDVCAAVHRQSPPPLWGHRSTVGADGGSHPHPDTPPPRLVSAIPLRNTEINVLNCENSRRVDLLTSE